MKFHFWVTNIHIFFCAPLYRYWGSVQAVRSIRGVEVYLYSFLTKALEGGEGSASRPDRSLPRERPGTHCTGGWVVCFKMDLLMPYHPSAWNYLRQWKFGRNHKLCHLRCVYNKLVCVYTCLTQLYGGIDMYNLLHKDQLHVSALIIGHLQVDNWKSKSLLEQLY